MSNLLEKAARTLCDATEGSGWWDHIPDYPERIGQDSRNAYRLAVRIVAEALFPETPEDARAIAIGIAATKASGMNHPQVTGLSAYFAERKWIGL